MIKKYIQRSHDMAESSILKNNGNYLTFNEWIRGFIDFEAPIGDLAREIKNDKEFPEDSFNFLEILDYLREERRVDEIVIGAFLNAWYLYWNFTIYNAK